MNQRDLSEKLDELATKLEETGEWAIVKQVIIELRNLSNENYAPGNGTTWDAIKPKLDKKTFTDKSGKKLPF